MKGGEGKIFTLLEAPPLGVVSSPAAPCRAPPPAAARDTPAAAAVVTGGRGGGGVGESWRGENTGGVAPLVLLSEVEVNAVVVEAVGEWREREGETPVVWEEERRVEGEEGEL